MFKHIDKYILLFFIMMSVFIYDTGNCQEAGSDPAYLFYKGNTHYEEGNYTEAIKAYDSLEQTGHESGNIYYNMGNSYFKINEPGMAILYYERALRLMPRDSDLNSNYNYAKSGLTFDISEHKVPLSRHFLNLFSFLSLNELTLSVSFLLLAAAAAFLARMYIFAFRKRSLFLIFLVFILILPLLYAITNRINLLNSEAVVITEIAEARFEPFKSATSHYTLYRGMKVRIISEKKDWFKIKRDDNKLAWVMAHEIKRI
ncbi:MAG: tetratricopeptide repeat protein [Nitrospira sp.]|nr:tetratricopeptide repeat protein [bacterium]MBL7048749.1 tetratricopeptide repeat protein [Nitrospira sp.]